MVNIIQKSFFFSLQVENIVFDKRIVQKCCFWGIFSQSINLNCFVLILKKASFWFFWGFCVLCFCLYFVVFWSCTLSWLMFFVFPPLNRESLGQWMSLGVKVPHRQTCLPPASLQIWSLATLGISKEKWQLKKDSEYPRYWCKHLHPSAACNVLTQDPCLSIYI